MPKWDGSAWSALGSGLNNEVRALAVSGTGLYVGGWFSTAGNKFSPYAASVQILFAPDAPTAVSAAAGNAQATVSFTAPASAGGHPSLGIPPPVRPMA